MQKACSPAALPSTKQKYRSERVLILLISLLIEYSSVTTPFLRMCPGVASVPCLSILTFCAERCQCQIPTFLQSTTIHSADSFYICQDPQRVVLFVA